MPELHPSGSAIGTHLDQQSEIIALAQEYYEAEGKPAGRQLEHWLRAEREVKRRYAAQASPPPDINTLTEEAMHLAI